jgi:hypothetical protein
MRGRDILRLATGPCPSSRESRGGAANRVPISTQSSTLPTPAADVMFATSLLERRPTPGDLLSALTLVCLPSAHVGISRRPALLMGNGKGVALPFLGGTCGQLGDACGRPELPRRDADEPLEVMGELALVREAGEYRSTQPVTSRFRLTSTACNIALWMSQSVASARLGSAPRLYLVATTPYHNNGPQVVQSQGRTSKGAL